MKLCGLTLEYIPEDDIWYVLKDDKALGIGESPGDAMEAALVYKQRQSKRRPK